MPPRKSLAHREPNGKPQRHPDGPSPTEIVRLRDAALAGLRDPVWATSMGWLSVSGKITNTQFATGKRWAELARDYAAAIHAPREPRSADLDPSGGCPPDPDSPRGLSEAHRHTRTVHRYLGALEALKLTSGAARRALRETCELGQMPAGDELKSLRAGLDRLATYWNGLKQK